MTQKNKNLDILTSAFAQNSPEFHSIRSYFSSLVLILAALFFIQDIYIDLIIEKKSFSHVFIESGIFLSILFALYFEIKRVLSLLSTVSDNHEQILKLKKRLHKEILDEFDRWGLTNTQKDIALMLIKGLSMKEIAEARNVKDKSVQAQATIIYSKANVLNRHELSSYFIESLLL